MIQTGLVIYYLLSGDTTLTSYVDTNVFPIIAPEDTPYPFIIYERSTNPDYTRDGQGLWDTRVDVTVLAETYVETILISQQVDSVLCSFSGELFGMNIRDIRLIDVSEQYNTDVFLQRITFNIKSN